MIRHAVVIQCDGANGHECAESFRIIDDQPLTPAEIGRWIINSHWLNYRSQHFCPSCRVKRGLIDEITRIGMI